MKKLLALVLALVMSMSLVTISNADFKDADKIDYNEAVDVMNAAGVLIGDENGNFNAKDTLTRAQAAKIISYLLLGNKTAEGLAGSGKFTDVAKTSWAAGFVDYCAAVGVVNGVGNGQFDPTGSLTTLQFAKMLLVALGYDAKIEGFVGSDWSINVSAKANQVGLLAGLDVSANAALTREQAAKMTLNTLKSPLVEYDTKGTTVTVGGDASVTVGASKAEFKTSTNKKAQTISNAVINGTTAYTVEFAEEYYPDLKLNSDTTDDFGRPCVEWFWKADSIGVYSNSDDLVATYTKEVTAADIYTAVGKSVSDDVNNDKSKATLVSYIDGDETKVAKANVYQYVTKNDTTTVNGTGNGDYTEVYVDDDNNVTIVTIRTYLFQAASDYNVKKDTITLTTAGDTNITLDNIVVDGEDFDIKSLKSDDYVLVTASKDKSSNKYTVQSVDAAEVVSGEVTGYKLDNSATIGGTEYKYSATSLKGSGKVRSTTYTVGQNARVVLDKYGYIIAVDEAVVSSNYVYVSEFAQPAGLANGKVVASAYFTDGTTADITVKDRYGNSSKTSIMGAPTTVDGTNRYIANAGWYTYSKNSANEYSLYAVEVKYTETNNKSAAINETSAGRVMKNDNVQFLPTMPAVKANNNTIVIVDDGSDVTVYTGVKNIPDITLRAGKMEGKLLADKNGYAGYVFVTVSGDATIAGNEDSKLVYYVKYDGQFKTTDNKVYYTYKVLDENGKEEVVKADSTSIGVTTLPGTSLIYGVYNKTRLNNDDYITSVSPVSTNGKFFYGTAGTPSNNIITSGQSLTYTDGALSLGGTGYTLADNAKITLVTKGEQKSGSTVIADARELNKNKAADYEVAVGLSGKALGDLLKDYALVYSYAGKLTDSTKNVIEELFVTVDYAAFTKGGVNNGGGAVVPTGVAVSYAGSVITVTATGTEPLTFATAKKAIEADLTNKGYTDITFRVPNAAHPNQYSIEATDKNGVVRTFTFDAEHDMKDNVVIKINGNDVSVPVGTTVSGLTTYGQYMKDKNTGVDATDYVALASCAANDHVLKNGESYTLYSKLDSVYGVVGATVTAKQVADLGLKDNSYVQIKSTGTVDEQHIKATELKFAAADVNFAGSVAADRYVKDLFKVVYAGADSKDNEYKAATTPIVAEAADAFVQVTNLDTGKTQFVSITTSTGGLKVSDYNMSITCKASGDAIKFYEVDASALTALTNETGLTYTLDASKVIEGTVGGVATKRYFAKENDTVVLTLTFAGYTPDSTNKIFKAEKGATARYSATLNNELGAPVNAIDNTSGTAKITLADAKYTAGAIEVTYKVTAAAKAGNTFTGVWTNS